MTAPPTMDVEIDLAKKPPPRLVGPLHRNHNAQQQLGLAPPTGASPPTEERSHVDLYTAIVVLTLLAVLLRLAG
jgi:hypothetical protein